MSGVRVLATDLPITREVYFAVELIDPFTQAIVSEGIEVSAPGLDRGPVRSLSGRFAWCSPLRPPDDQPAPRVWPTSLVVTSSTPRYVSEERPAPPPPANAPAADDPESRRIRIVLRPGSGYDGDEGATAVRGQLVEDASVRPPVPIADVVVQLQWEDVDQAGTWSPAAPTEAAALAEKNSAAPFRETRTDERGVFVVTLAAVPAARHPAVTNGLISARLQFTRLVPAYRVKTTPANFEFLPAAEAPEDHVRLGRLLTLDRPLSWKSLDPEDP